MVKSEKVSVHCRSSIWRMSTSAWSGSSSRVVAASMVSGIAITLPIRSAQLDFGHPVNGSFSVPSDPTDGEDLVILRKETVTTSTQRFCYFDPEPFDLQPGPHFDQIQIVGDVLPGREILAAVDHD